MSVTHLTDKVGMTMADIAVSKKGKAKAIRLSILEASCRVLEYQPGDILEYEEQQQQKPRLKPHPLGLARPPHRSF